MTKRFAAFAFATAIALAAPAMADSVRLTGSGASFPFPIYSAWFKDFAGKSDGITVDYQSKGSGAGIQDFTNKVVDFAASNSAMTDEQIAAVDQGVVLLPMTAGEIVVAFNLPGVTELKLPRDVYPEIFLGTITNWNDPKIAEANPDVDLPDMPITVVVRSNSSGTTFNFTSHLAADQRGLQDRPRRRQLGAVAGLRQDHQGAEERWHHRHRHADPGRDRLYRVRLRQADRHADGDPPERRRRVRRPRRRGRCRGAGVGDVRRPHARLHHRPAGRRGLPDRDLHLDGFYEHGQDAAKVAAIKEMVEYGLTDGQAMAEELGYIPMPEAVIEKVRAAAQDIGAGA